MGRRNKDREVKESSQQPSHKTRACRRGGNTRHASHRVSQSEERDKIKESVLEAFRSRLKSSPNQCGALVVGPSKTATKATTARRRSDRHCRTRHAERHSIPESSDGSYYSMSDSCRRRDKITFKRKSRTKRNKQKTKEVEREPTSGINKHIKIARGISTTGGAITHARVTQPLGLVNAGKKSLAVTRGGRKVQVPAHIQRETEEDLRRIVDTSDSSVQPTLDLDQVQSSSGTEVSMSPEDQDKFPKTLLMRETVRGLMPSLQNLNKQMYPGRDFLKETTADLLKLLKQNAPRSATPTPVPLMSKTGRSRAVQRSLASQFEADSRRDKRGGHCGSADARLSLSGTVQSQVIRHGSRPSSGTMHHHVPQHDRPSSSVVHGGYVTQRSSGHSPMQQSNSDPYDYSVAAFQPLNTQTDTFRKCNSTGLNSFKKSAQTHLDNLLSLQKKSQLGQTCTGTGKENLHFANRRNLLSGDNKPGVYIVKKPRQCNNSQILYESAKLLKTDSRQPDIWEDLYKQDNSNDLNDLVSNSVINKLHKRYGNPHTSQPGEDRNNRTVYDVCSVDEWLNQTNETGEDLTIEIFTQPSELLPDAQSTDAQSMLEKNAEIQQQHEAMDVESSDAHEAVRILQKNDIREAEKSRFAHTSSLTDLVRAGNQFGLVDNGNLPLGTQLQAGYVDAGSQPSLQSHTSSQCSRCSLQSKSPLKCVEADYMPSFHGNYYKSHCTTDDLTWEHPGNHEKDTPLNILDYIDSSTIPTDGRRQMRSAPPHGSSPGSDCSDGWRAPNHLQGLALSKPFKDSPSEKHTWYPRHMY